MIGRLAPLIGLLVLSSCVARSEALMRSVMSRLLPKRVDAFARGYLEQIQRGSIDSAMRFLEPSLQTSAVRPELVKIAAVLKGTPIDSAEVVGVNVSNGDPGVHTNVTYQLHGDTAWVLGNVAVVETSGAFRVEGLHAQFMHESLATTNALTLANKPGFYGAFAAVAILIVLFNFSVAVMAVRSRIRRRWLWAVLALAGFGGISLNWTTGNVSFQLLNVQLFGAGILKGGLYAPWVASCSFPVLAVIALIKIRRASRVAAEPASSPPTK